MTAKSSLSRLLVVGLLVLLASARLEAAERWYNYYENGLRLMKEQKYAQAIVAFEQALSGLYEDQPKKVQTYGMHFIEYHPHREIGIAAYYLGDMERAREELELALAYNPSDARAAEFYAKVTGGVAPPVPGGPAPELAPPPTPARPGLSKDEILEVQRALAYRGYYEGAIDGVIGPRTEGAVKVFQEEAGLSPTGSVDEQTLAAIRRVKVPKDFRSARPTPTPGTEETASPAHQEPARPSGKVQRVVPYLSVGVLPLSAGRGVEDVGTLVAERMVTSLVGYQRFQVNERIQMDKIMKELKFGLTDLVDPATAAKLGKQAGVDCLVMGSVNRTGTSIDMDLRLVDTETGEVLAARSGQCPESDPAQLRRTVADIAAYFANILPLVEGTVVKVDPDGTIYVSLGSRQGMRKGMKLHVFTEGDPIVHPATGKTLGRVRRSKTQIVLTQVMEMYSMGRQVEGEGTPVNVNDPVVTK